MGIKLDAVGTEGPEIEVVWSHRDAILYALGVGAAIDDPEGELAFTTENSEGVTQRVLPTFAVVASAGRLPDLGQIDPAMILHAEQGIVLHSELPPSGRARVQSLVRGIYDKGSGALFDLSFTARDAQSGALLAESRLGMFVRGAGGFGGERGPPPAPALPDRAPDHVITYRSRPEQALVYRLSGDRNPLHSDPVYARKAGFDQPILHGLCTYGFAGRALLHCLCAGDPARFRSMDGRFTQTVLPGDALTISIWREDAGQARFNVARGDGAIVFDRGRASFTI